MFKFKPFLFSESFFFGLYLRNYLFLKKHPYWVMGLYFCSMFLFCGLSMVTFTLFINHFSSWIYFLPFTMMDFTVFCILNFIEKDIHRKKGREEEIKLHNIKKEENLLLKIKQKPLLSHPTAKLL